MGCVLPRYAPPLQQLNMALMQRSRLKCFRRRSSCSEADIDPHGINSITVIGVKRNLKDLEENVKLTET